MAKSKFETHVAPYIDKISEWLKAGCDFKTVASNLHITYSTLWKYKVLGEQGQEPYVDFANAFAQACVEPDENVENSLYKSATGYNAKFIRHYKVKTIQYDPETGKKISEKEELKPMTDEVHVPANVAAQQFWLTNRLPDKWKYKPESVRDKDDDTDTGVVLLPEVATDGS